MYKSHLIRGAWIEINQQKHDEIAKIILDLAEGWTA